MPPDFIATCAPTTAELHFSSRCSAAEVRKLQRRHRAGQLTRIYKGMYVEAVDRAALELRVRKNWQAIAGAIAPGAVVSHVSAMTGGMAADGTVVLSHPTLNKKKLVLPGVTLVLVAGPGPLPGDLPLGSTGLHCASRTRCLLENLGKQAPRRAGREAVAQRLVSIFNTSGEHALNEIREQAGALAAPLSAERSFERLCALINALSGMHARAELRAWRAGPAIRSFPVETERMERFEILASALRNAALPHIEARCAPGLPRQHFAFLESYFSNYVEGTKFDIEQARDIVLFNHAAPSRSKDLHDLLGVFRLASTAPYKNSPPVAGEDFLVELQAWHAEMLRMRSEANPGKTKERSNYAGTTEFVRPENVRGTLIEGSRLALSVPEGIARALYYAFLISEIHPFEDGNGRLSRLVMNAELSRVGLNRIIIPTLYHLPYVDSVRALTHGNDPTDFIKTHAAMAIWCSEFDYGDLGQLIGAIRGTNALEEASFRYRLLCADGQSTLLTEAAHFATTTRSA